MADSQNQGQSQEPDPQSEAEDAFWKRLHTEMDTWFDEKIKTMREQGQSRVGRTTLPSIFADFMFGKQQDKK